VNIVLPNNQNIKIYFIDYNTEPGDKVDLFIYQFWISFNSILHLSELLKTVWSANLYDFW